MSQIRGNKEDKVKEWVKNVGRESGKGGRSRAGSNGKRGKIGTRKRR